MVGGTGAPASSASFLRRYLQMYWLKPFDAVNDAANAWALRQFPWEEPILEVGGGDGVFSFIMHDGEFALTEDRYDQADPDRAGDLFDVYRNGYPLRITREASRSYLAGVDLKPSHVLKARQTRLYRWLGVAAPEPLPFESGAFKTVFLYFPHGLKERGSVLDYGRVLREIRRVLRPDGTLLMTAVNQTISECFVCYPWQRVCARRSWQKLSNYFQRLDAGRYEEIVGLGRTPDEWRVMLESSGFRLEEAWTQVSPLAWRVYDIQTRPVLKALIRWSRFLKRVGLKRVVKAVWVAVWWPMLAVFYWMCARPRRFSLDSGKPAGLFFAFRAVAT